jgi:N-glycosylase/DNA lyase
MKRLKKLFSKKRIQKAEDYLEKANQEKLKNNYHKSISNSLKAWNSVVLAKKFLEKF